jgi:MscS family membrane protein
MDENQINDALNGFDFLRQEVINGNEVWRFCLLFLFIFGAFLVGKGLKWSLGKSSTKLTKSSNPLLSALFFALAKSSTLLAVAIGTDIGLQLIKMTPQIRALFDIGTDSFLTVAFATLFYYLVKIPERFLKKIAAKDGSKLDKAIIPILTKTLHGLIILFAAVQLAQVLSKQPISSIIAGLGIGGLAIALAAQDTVKNFFGSLLILSDKPFEIGQRVVIDSHEGTIESIGVRSTRLRTLDGHLVTIPNGELANKAVRNVASRPHMKRTLNVTITYDTPVDKVLQGVNIIKELLDNHEGMRMEFPPRVFFNDLNSDSLNILVVYWYYPPDYWMFLAFNERFNFELLRRFNEAGIEFAFPTQTLYLAGDNNRPLTVGITEERTPPTV